MRKRFDVEVPDGQHLGFSRDTDGAYRAHLFSDESNDLVGHAELFEPDEDKADSSDGGYVYGPDPSATERPELTAEEVAAALEALLGLAVVVTSLAIEAAPHVKRWWNEQLHPAFKSTWNRVESTWNRIPKRIGAGKQATNAHTVTVLNSIQEESPTDLVDALEDYRVQMSSAEAQERFISAMLARAFYEEQLRILRNATIEDGGDTLELGHAIESVTPEQVGGTLKLMLEKNPSLVSRESLVELGKIFEGARTDGERVPLRIERLKKGPHLDIKLPHREAGK